MTILVKIDGIKGSNTSQPYEGAIKVESYHLQASRNVSKNMEIGDSRTTGKVMHSSIIMNKLLDEASTDLLKYFYEAKAIPKVTFYHLSSGKTPQCYLQQTFKDVIVSRFAESNNIGSVLEEIELTFISNEKRTSILDKNNVEGTPKSIGFDSSTLQVI